MPRPIPDRESLTVEFKSDQDRLPDRDLVETVVCLANSEGGTIYLGVEDDGTPTGLHPVHQQLEGLGALVANRTSPSVTVDVEPMEVDGHPIARIVVPKADRITSTTDGVFRHRRLGHDGLPECVPFLPHEIPSRLSSLGSFDASAQHVPGATLGDLDPTERARLRQFVERFNGDRALLDLSDDELDGALGLTILQEKRRLPTLLGLLLIGREAALRQRVPTHELAFQVLEGEEVRTNEFSRAPLLRLFEWVETLFTPLNPEEEILAGMVRVAIPRVDRRAFREAIANTMTHRDYAQLGAIHVRLETEALSVSNPGGFVAGVRLENLLTTDPRPRNPQLADAFKRIGLVERTGRGVQIIYRAMLRFGRPRPDYSRSDRHMVVLRLPTAEADRGFLRMILDEEKALEGPLPIDSLIALSALREQRRITQDELIASLQKDEAAVGRTLKTLAERGLVKTQGQGVARTYMPGPRFTVQVTEQVGLKDKVQVEVVRMAAGQVTVQVAVQVLKKCQEPQKASEIQELAGIKHRPTFKANYLDPLMDKGWLEMTVADKPRSQLQRYRTTKSGRQWMEEHAQ